MNNTYNNIILYCLSIIVSLTELLIITTPAFLLYAAYTNDVVEICYDTNNNFLNNTDVIRQNNNDLD